MKRRGFTLIELLVVMVIIGILFGLLTSAIRKSLVYSNERRAASDRKSLSSAFQAYRHEYGQWPLPSEATTNYTGDNYRVIKTLSDTDTNPRKIKFLNISDYKTSPTNGAVLNAASGSPFSFVFNLVADTCSVY